MKKLSTTKQILNILNTQGGKKPKQLIALTKASSASVYNALHQLRNKKMIAKEDDGVYISQTQKSVSKVTNKGGWKAVSVSVQDKSIRQNTLSPLKYKCMN
jgi:DeoR/GlpR family transcriptional regulator of sugar metabolism